VSDPQFGKVTLKPKTLGAVTRITRQLLVQSPDARALIIADLGRALSSQVDRAVFYGAGGNAPLGILNHPNTVKLPIGSETAPTYWDQITELEYQIGLANIPFRPSPRPEPGEEFGVFGWIISPIVARDYRRNLPAQGTELMHPLVSNVISDAKAFAGCWQVCYIGIWETEILVNPFRLAEQGLVEVAATMQADVGFRYPNAFGVLS
jgi:hypothetical protein